MEISLFCTCARKILMIWSTVLEIYSVTDWYWSLWVIFCPSTPLKTKKIRILKKRKNLPKISSFYTSVPKTTMRYSSWDAEWDKHIFFVILGHFLPFTPPPPNNLENQNFEKKKRKKHPEMSSFYTVHQKSWSYDVCFLRDGVWQTSCHFGPFFALLPQYRP